MAFYKRQPDIIIRNGTIIDGTGKPGYFADIAIIGDRIDYIGNLKGVSAPLEIDATGKFVTPGFIDSHSHSDINLFAHPLCQSAVRQGVTTEVVGNCGFSMRSIGKELFDPAGDGSFDLRRGSADRDFNLLLDLHGLHARGVPDARSVGQILEVSYAGN